MIRLERKSLKKCGGCNMATNYALSGTYNEAEKTVYIGKKPFGIRTYENLVKDLSNPNLEIETVDMTEVSIGQRAINLLLEVNELDVHLRLSQVHEQELVSLVNSGTQQIDEMGSEYVNWLIKESQRLNNPLMVVEEDGKIPSLVQYLGDKGDSIRLKKILPYATQPSVCERELKLGRDIYSIITINKSDIVTKEVVWRFIGTGLEMAIADTLTAVINGQLTFQG